MRNTVAVAVTMLIMATVVVMSGAQTTSCGPIFPVEDMCTTLPMLKIDALNQFINKTWPNPKIYVKMELTDNPSGVNYFDDPANVYEGQARFKVRGQTSRANAKNSFTLDTWQDHTPEEKGKKRKVVLIGESEGWKWVLYAPWGDKTLMKNAIVYNITNQMGQYATRTRYVELVMRADNTGNVWNYRGVYVLEEKIARASDRVDIAKLAPGDNSEPEITGGYILKKDKLRDGEEAFKIMLPSGTRILGYEPDYEDITAAQKAWITDYMVAFETALNATDVWAAVSPFINATSWADGFLIQETFLNSDGFRASAYMFKDRSGPLCIGPVWDVDVTFANVLTPTSVGWQFKSWGLDVPFWWERLLGTHEFKSLVIARWKHWRSHLLTNETFSEIRAFYESQLFYPHDQINSPVERNFHRWQILDSWHWPGLHSLHHSYPPYPIQNFADWFPDRLAWIDAHIHGLPHGPPVPDGALRRRLEVVHHPTTL